MYIVNALVSKFSNIQAVINVNEKTNGVIWKIIIYGDGIIEDLLGKYKFVISPNSFYQVNPVQLRLCIILVFHWLI